MALIDKHSRFFVRHYVSFRPRSPKANPLEFIADGEEIDVRTLLEEAIKRNRAKFEIRVDDEVRLTAMDVREKDNIAILLFRRSDPTAAPQVLENIKTHKLRAVKLGKDEYPAVSAHLFIQLTKKKLPNPTYRALLEEVPGLGRTYIHQVLHNVVRDFRYTYEDKKKEKETYSIVGMDGVPSDTVGSALKGSDVPYVELVRPGQIPGLDDTNVVAREQKMKLILRVNQPAKILETLNRIKNWAVEWTEMRVRLDLPEDRSRLISIARTEDAKDVLFIRSIPVATEQELAACTDVVNEELIGKALELFEEKD